MKLKVGDKVKILDGKSISDPMWISWVRAEMCAFIGKETYVTKVFSTSVSLNIDQDMFCWAEYWLEKVED